MIEILNQQNRFWLYTKTFEDLLKGLIKHYKLKDPEISLVLVNTKVIKRLNKKYLNKDESTDVLSFPIGEKGADGKFYLGDIVISVPQAFKQCFSQAHGLERELKLLTIHGFLHLLGFKHSKGIEKEEEKIRNLMLKG